MPSAASTAATCSRSEGPLAKNAKIKSLFLLPAIGTSALLCVASLVMIAVAAGNRLAWFGSALAAAPLPFLVLRLRYRPVARTSEFLPLHLAASLVGIVLACQGMYGNFVASWELYRDFAGALVSAVNPTAQNLPGLVALLAGLLLALYVFWYSAIGRYPDARLDVGSRVPEFEARDVDGNTIRSTDFLGSPAVFLFYRGNWCPLCMAQIDELVERYRELERLGIAVCLISPQSGEKTRELASRHDVRFHYLIDEGNRAADSLGIAVRNGVPMGVPGDYAPDTVMPTMFVTSAGGTILFSDQTDNYRVRPEPDIFLAILRRAGVASA